MDSLQNFGAIDPASDSRALAHGTEGVVEHCICHFVAQVAHKYMEVVASVLLVIVGQGPVDPQLLAKVGLAIKGPQNGFCHDSVTELDETIAGAGATGLVLQQGVCSDVSARTYNDNLIRLGQGRAGLSP